MRDAVRSCWEMFRVAWRHSPGRLLVALTLVTLEGFAWPGLALALKGAVDAAVAGDVRAAGTYGALVAVAAIGALLLHHFSYVPYVEVSELVQLAHDEELIRLSNGSAGTEHHERPEYADKLHVLERELGAFDSGMAGLMTAVSLVVSMVLTAVILAGVHPWLLLLPLAAVPPVLAGQRAQRILDRSREEAAPHVRQAEHLLTLATSAASAKELRVWRLRDDLVERHDRVWSRGTRILWHAERRAALVQSAGQLVFAAAYVGAVLLTLRDAVAGGRSLGDVVLVITLAAQVNQQVTTGLTLLQTLQRVAQALTRLRWTRALVAAQEPPPPDAPLPATLHRGVELHGVSFTYPGTDRPVLSGVDLLLPAGATVAIVGENGAGKTTLVKLLCRFYEATEGRMTVDGVDLRRLPLDEWRGRTTAGFQDFVRYELEAGRVVGLGDLPHLDDDEAVLAALERAGAQDILHRLDDGLATQLGTSWADGTELSGGQWQKLALGRTMMRQLPLLMVLDEPTSALDAEAEHRLFEQYASNARRVGRATGAITVLISHRFSTVRMADLILVVADGRVVEAGDHEQLMAAGRTYADLYTLQAAAYR
jgi:ATP-binding cassette subfamily B protein